MGVDRLRVIDASVMPRIISRKHKCSDDHDCGKGRGLSYGRCQSSPDEWSSLRGTEAASYDQIAFSRNRHCEERGDEAMQGNVERPMLSGLLRSARNNGAGSTKEQLALNRQEGAHRKGSRLAGQIRRVSRHEERHDLGYLFGCTVAPHRYPDLITSSLVGRILRIHFSTSD